MDPSIYKQYTKCLWEIHESLIITWLMKKIRYMFSMLNLYKEMLTRENTFKSIALIFYQRILSYNSIIWSYDQHVIIMDLKSIQFYLHVSSFQANYIVPRRRKHFKMKLSIPNDTHFIFAHVSLPSIILSLYIKDILWTMLIPWHAKHQVLDVTKFVTQWCIK